MSNDRLTPKEIKAWCLRLYWKELESSKHTHYRDLLVNLMYKSYKRGYQDALGG